MWKITEKMKQNMLNKDQTKYVTANLGRWTKCANLLSLHFPNNVCLMFIFNYAETGQIHKLIRKYQKSWGWIKKIVWIKRKKRKRCKYIEPLECKTLQTKRDAIYTNCTGSQTLACWHKTFLFLHQLLLTNNTNHAKTMQHA